MKSLTLLRHAKSSWDAPVPRDFDRPLTDRGRLAASRIGHYLLDEGLTFDLVVSSSAVRTRETIAIVQAETNRVWPVTFDDRVYMASADTLLDLIQDVPSTVQRLLLVGHNPGFEDLAQRLIGSGSLTLRNELKEKFPTAALAELTFDVPIWDDVSVDQGKLVRYVRPKVLDKTLDDD